MEAAKEAKCRVLILSAFGCGAYENPPRDVAELFHTVLTKYQKDFDTVMFRIKDGIFEYGERPPHITSSNFVMCSPMCFGTRGRIKWLPQGLQLLRTK